MQISAAKLQPIGGVKIKCKDNKALFETMIKKTG
jgi:hypothetical protein